MFNTEVKETVCTHCAHREVCIYKQDFRDIIKARVSEMSGTIILWILEGRSIGYMSEKLCLSPQQIESNIDEMLFVLKKHVGKRRFFKILLTK